MNDAIGQIQLKNLNRRMVLNYIRRNVNATKAGLASVTGLTFMAIKKILEELIDLNLLRNDQMEDSGIGRKAVTYTINENYGYTIGVHVNMFITSAAVMDLHGKILAKENIDMSKINMTQHVFVDMLVEIIQNAVKNSGVDASKILGIGIGVPGPVNIRDGILLTPPNMRFLQYLPLKEIIEKRTGFRVLLQKDTNAIALGEYWRGAGIGYSDVVYIDIDMGFGNGLVINGKIREGSNYAAGELGHITIDINGPQCNCGNRGCLEAMSSGIAILKEYALKLNENTDNPLYEKRNNLVIEDIFEAAEKNDLLAISILNQSAYYAGIGIGNLINILDPEIIVLGGMLINHYPRYFHIAKDVANSRKLKGSRENEMVVSKLKTDAGVIGGGELVADAFFNEIVNEILSGNNSVSTS